MYLWELCGRCIGEHIQQLVAEDATCSRHDCCLAPPCRFYLIANGILYRHWYHPGVNKPWLALGIMFYFTAISLGAPLLNHLPATSML
jgi:hypothetical protein